MQLLRTAAALVLLWPVVTVSADQSAPPRRVSAPHTSVELIADRSAVPPGGSLRLGVRFVLEPGWHIYWLNPGDSGGAPTLDWRLPTGFVAGPIEWPVPERIEVSSLVNYGYHGDVVLPVEIRVPKQPGAAGRLAFGAGVHWLVCQELCVPGDAKLEITLPLQPSSGAGQSEWPELIALARARVPRAAPPSWKARAVSTGDYFVLSVETGQRETSGLFFPIDESRINDSTPQKIAPLERGLRFTLRKSNQLVKLPPSLKGVVRLADGRAFVVTAPVVEGAKSQERSP
jgi:DsbC/DsbD-like thiol-disulfide interchange protein